MEIFGILGNRGAFKTCRMVAALYDDYLAGDKITANFKLNFPYQRRSFAQVRDELLQMEATSNSATPYVPTFKGHILAFDEISTGADAYDFMMADNKLLSWLASQLRKLDCIMYYTDQRWGKVVKRIRDLTNKFWLMRDLDEGVMHYPDGTPARRHFDVCAGQGEYIICDDDLEPISGRIPFDARPYYALYDTKELVFDVKSAKK